jgi:hypothetical protein
MQHSIVINLIQMKQLSVLVFLFAANVAFSHKNVHVSRTYGNVTVESSTCFYNEEITKNLIIAKYAEILSNRYSYTGTIRLLLLDNNEMRFSIWDKRSEEKEDDDLNIMIVSPGKDISKSISLIEKAILNKGNLSKFKKDFPNWYSGKLTEISRKIFEIKIERPNDVKELPKIRFFNCFFQNLKYHFTAVGDNCDSKEDVMIFDEIIQINETHPYIICVIAANEEVTVCEAKCEYDSEQKKFFMKDAVTKFNLKNTDQRSSCIHPYHISGLGQKYISFETLFGDRVSIYSLSKKILVDNLDEIIK